MSWKIENKDGKIERQFIAANDGSGTVVCRPADTCCRASLKLWPERAHVIIAAPEAIAVLREVSAELDNIEHIAPEFSILLDKVNAVILKSEGKGE